MTRRRPVCLRVTAAALLPGTTVRYHDGADSSLATVVDRTGHSVTLAGEGCDGTYTTGQLERLLATGHLRIVLGPSSPPAADDPSS